MPPIPNPAPDDGGPLVVDPEGTGAPDAVEKKVALFVAGGWIIELGGPCPMLLGGPAPIGLYVDGC